MELIMAILSCCGAALVVTATIAIVVMLIVALYECVASIIETTKE